MICYYNDPMDQPGANGPTDPLEWELFDLVADPLEVNNVWNQPECSEVQAELLLELARLQHSVGDQPYETDATGS